MPTGTWSTSSTATARCSCATRRSSRSLRRQASTGQLRARILADAVALAETAGYVNAGTVEFLVSPETGEYFFIECNPRIQVEHTVTEQVTGIDLVEAQFRIAGGASLADLGLDRPARRRHVRGFAVQARRRRPPAPACSRAYKEPSGPGARRRRGYTGYAPPPQFDPLLAKVIATSVRPRRRRRRRPGPPRGRRRSTSPVSPTNRAQLLGDPRPSRRARRRRPHDAARRGAGAGRRRDGAVDAPLAERSLDGNAGAPRRRGAEPPGARRRGRRTSSAVRSPMGGTVVDVRVAVGDVVRARRRVWSSISAMKMEAVVTAPCAGAVVGLLALQPGDRLDERRTSSPSSHRPTVGRTRASSARPRRDVAARCSTTSPSCSGLAAARLRPGLRRPGCRAPAHPRQVDVSRAHRPAARRRARSARSAASPGSPATTSTGASPRSRRPTTSAAGARSRAARPSCAPTTSRRAAVTPTGRSGPRASTSTSCRCRCRSRRSACSTARRAAAA